jgi:hypothetical protein
MVCPPWNGVDTAGRPAHWNSFYTKTPGCNSANDRVTVENALRPQYVEYVNLDATGISGGCPYPGQQMNPDSLCAKQSKADIPALTGQFGDNVSQHIFPNCVTCSDMSGCSQYPDNRSYNSQQMRKRQQKGQARKVANKRVYW